MKKVFGVLALVIVLFFGVLLTSQGPSRVDYQGNNDQKENIEIIKTEHNLYKIGGRNVNTGTFSMATTHLVDIANIFEMELNGKKVYVAVEAISMGYGDEKNNGSLNDMKVKVFDMNGKNVLIDNYADTGFYKKNTLKEIYFQDVLDKSKWQDNLDIDNEVEKFISSPEGKKSIRKGFTIQ